VLNGRVKRGGF